MAASQHPLKVNRDRAPSGKVYFRAYFPDPITGKRRKVSTGVEVDGTKSAEVRAWSLALEIYQAAKTVPPPAQPRNTLGDLLDGFWDPEHSDYLKARLARDPEAISPEALKNYVYTIKKHVMPFVLSDGRLLVSLPVAEIEPDHLDEMVTHVLSQGYSTRTAKGVIYAIAPAFRWAVRKHLAKHDPVPSMMPFRNRPAKRDAFTPMEVAALLNPATVATVWAGIKADTQLHAPHDPWRPYAVALLTALTSARVSTVLALDREDLALRVVDGLRYYVVTLDKTLRRKRGVTPGTKTGDGTEVPVAAELLDEVLKHLPRTGRLFVSLSKYGFALGSTGVISYRTARIAMVEAMRRIRITDEEREARKLGFHAFRHAFETRARSAGLSREIRSGFTEHRSIEVSDGYAHPAPEDLIAVLPMQRALISG